MSDEIKAYIPLNLGNQDINNGGLYNGCDVNDMKDLLLLNTNAISAKLDKTTADGLYAPLTGANYLTTADASSTYLAKEDATTLYATTSSLSNYITTASADTYLTKTTADGIYSAMTDLATTNGNVGTLTTKTQNLSATSAYSQFSKPLDMMTNVITNVGTPTINVHASNKLYVDSEITTRLASKLSTTGGTISGPLTIQGTLALGANAINCGPITASKFSTNGLSTEFLKANGDIDGKEYLTTASALTTYGKLTDVNTLTTTVSAHTNSISSLSSTRLNINGNNSMQADLSVGHYKIINVSAPTADNDATTKLYVAMILLLPLN